ncbi:MAG: rhomboid family intramembrane serine protease [Chitinophagales bacterium]|jgi:membrane associated rhomboid family serine protease|nr:rhomboid family intramembrane serine protease [Chitinophagales bacterium]
MITYIIIGITVITSLMAFNNQKLLSDLMFNAYVIDQRKQYFRFVSSGLIHADLGHLFFNMFTLYFFGTAVENSFRVMFPEMASTLYILLYISGLIMSSLFSFFKHKENPHYNALGASGAVSAILFCSIMIYPTMGISIYFLPGIPAYIFGPLYLMYCVYMAKRGMDNIGHEAHFFGAVWGILYIVVLHHQVLPRFFEQIF